MKTKIFALVLALVLVFSMAMSVSATESGTGGALELLVGNGKGTVTVDVYLQGDGITNGSITVNFDATVLTVADVKVSDTYAMHSVNAEVPGSITLTWVGSQLTAEKSLMLTVQLEVAEGTDKDLTYTACADCFTDSNAVEVASASVTVPFDIPVDTEALQKAIAAAQAVDASLYTEESYAAVTAALNTAMSVLTDAKATQEDVNAAEKALYDAIAALEEKVVEADTTKLEAAIKAASALDKSLYTTDSFAKLEKALAAAKAVLVKEDATQDEVDAALVALEDAIAALKKVDTGSDTGDNSRVLLWSAVMLLSLAAAITIMVAMIRNGRGKQVSRFLSLLVVSAMLLSMAPVTGLAIVKGENSDKQTFLENLKDIFNSNTLLVEGEDKTFAGTVKQVFDQLFDLKQNQNMDTSANQYAPTDVVRILVELEGECLLDQGYTQNQIAAFGAQVAHDSAKLKTVQDHVFRQIQALAAEAKLGNVSIKYHYTVALNGMALSVPYGILAQIRALDNVKNACICSQYDAPEAASSEPVSAPNMYATTTGFGSAQTWHELGYTGQGMTIAILDTGLDIDHPSFVDAPANPSMSVEDVQAVLTELNAYSLYRETSTIPLEAEDLYRNEKVPYGFNYVDNNLEITHDYDKQGPHGSHVAGTAAANKIATSDVVGVAPDAQIIVMKLFGENGGAYTDDIMAAIEDCVLLGVDAINMSLGSSAGFTDESALINAVFGRVLEHDMMLVVSSGNSTTAATGNAQGTNLNYTSDPDNGLVSSPATYLGSTVVASVENSHVMLSYFAAGEEKIAFWDANYTFHELEGTYQFVVIPGYGRAEDYEGLDLTGKVAVVSRGGGEDINFLVKQENAYLAGAVALVVYDNTDGTYLNMYDGGFLPNVFITKKDGERMLAQAVNGVGTIQIMPVNAQIPVPYWYANAMSDFSSWGVTPDLQLMPDVTAPGGNIYSCISDGEYATMSGTSMAAPHITGMSALVLQYLHDVYPELDDATYHTIAESLIMCTAVPLIDANGVLYSPRQQGSGSANVYKAVTSPVYLTSYQKTTGELTPKASLGDDPQRTGYFTFSFDMHNLTGTAQVYTLDGNLLTDQVLEQEGKKYISETGRDLTGAVTFEVLNTQTHTQYDMNLDGRTDMDDVQLMLDVFSGKATATANLDVNGDGTANTMDAQALYRMLLAGFEPQTVVTVPANSSVTINVSVQLSEEDMAYMDANYENGIYVDGFVRAYAQAENGVDLSLPFMGFYGSWNDAPVFDIGWYYEDQDTVEYNRYLHVIFATLGNTGEYGGLGMNPYLPMKDDPYNPAHNVLSPNGDGFYDYIPEMYISLMRSAELLDFTWTDDATGEQLFYDYYAYARKSFFVPAYGMCAPLIYSQGGLQSYTFYDENGKLVVEDLQHLTLTIRGFLDDGDLDNVAVDENGNPLPDHAWADGVMEIPVVIDMKAPTMDLDSLKYYTEDGRNYVTFQISDNYDIAAVVTTTVGGGVYDYVPVDAKTEGVNGESATITLDITNYDTSFKIVLGDYGCNETHYELTNVGNEGLAEDEFFAFRRYSTPEVNGSLYATDALNGWYSFFDADKMLMHTAQADSQEPTVYAAEYVDGYVFGAQAGEFGYNTLFVMKAGSWDRIDLGSSRAMYQTVYEWPGREETYFPLQMVALDMAFDYTTNTMYMLANALENETYFPEGEVNILLSMDLLTGEITILGKIFAEEGEDLLALTLACDNSGTLYTINHENGKLYTINKTPAETTPEYGFGSYMATCVSTEDAKYFPAAYTQSMTVDHETDTLYWAAYQGYVGAAYFIEMDKSTGQIVGMTQTADNAEMVGLFKPWDSGTDVIPSSRLKGITMRHEALYLNVGQNVTLSINATPYNAKVGKVTYTSADESVATVNEYGIVVATGIGSTTITATCGTQKATCLVSVSNVSGALFAHSGEYWLLMDAGRPLESNQVADAMELEGTVTAAAYRNGFLFVSTLVTSYDEDDNTVYTTNLYKLAANTLHGELLGSFEGNITALAFNYADGFLYGLNYQETLDADWNMTASYQLIRVNMATAETLVVTTLDAIYPYSDLTEQYATCSGALAIDYDGNFYVNGTNENWEETLVRFNLDQQDQIANITTYTGFHACHYGGDAMVWSESNQGLLYASGSELFWVDVSDMEQISTIALGTIRGASSTVLALAAPTLHEPEVEGVAPNSLTLDNLYSVPEGETVKVVPSLKPWNAVGDYLFTIADENIAMVDENGVVTGLTIGETTLVVKELASGLEASTIIRVTKNPGYLYGYLQANLSQQLPLESWAKLPLANAANFSWMHYNTYDLTVYAAAYYDGLVYAVGTHHLGGHYAFTMNPSNCTYNIVCEMDMMVRAMAFDYTTGTMYALASTETVAGGLYQVNLETMEFTFLADNDLGTDLVAMAIDAEGNMWASNTSGDFFSVDKHTGKLQRTDIVGKQSMYLSSMTYDFNNDTIYWAVGGYIYDVNTAESTLNAISYTDSVISGLFTIPTHKVAVPESTDPAGVVMQDKNTVAVGKNLAIDAVVLPISVATVDQYLHWTTSDATVAMVDANGVVTGIAPGVAYITATDAKGNSDTIMITVTESDRFFYGYDEVSRSWVRFDLTGRILQTWADAEGLSPIVTARYINGVLYAYDADGFFYSIDTETFQRTLLGNGIHGLTTSLEAWDNSHNGQVYFVDNIPYQMVDMTYSTVTDAFGFETTTMYGVMMAYNISDWRDDFSYQIAELDMQTGEILRIIAADELVDGMSLRPTNLIWRDGSLYTINGYITGLVTKIDVNTGNLSGIAICPQYWGDFNGGRSIIEDPLTGAVYAVRDMRTPYIGNADYTDAYSASILCSIALGVGYVDEIATIGSNIRLTGLFIK